ncbi:transcription factor MYBS3-like [Macadamia integrifolia]|uniref:transcription factor MYBS3-like n=1 Tax=Macadamia integrifolia TaxID=60698 RepID=UPI001C4E9F1B|nr:transcription factor MYBS3-like [Macadamia integrifolia]XP_042476277.1 transcription factor MYBS3-like [Macadamia integrifolia]
MTRRCSHCSHNGHNSRTCPTRGGVKLFGVRLTDGSIKKSASMGNLASAHYSSSASASASPNPGSPSSDHFRDPTVVAEGYVSDDPAHTSCSSNCRGDRKKGTPWTEEEHRLFLLGLQKLGKGDWRGIARNFVMSRTPTQVASHAQKYFIRQSNASRRKRRSSLFDMVPDMSIDSTTGTEEHLLCPTSQAGETENVNPKPPLNLFLDQDEPMEATSNDALTEAEETITSSNFPPMIPGFYPTYLPVPFSFWPPSPAPEGEEKQGETSQHQVLKPTPIHTKDPVNVEQLVGMSKLSLGEAAKGRLEPSSLSQKWLGTPSRQSAFHANPPVSDSELSQNTSVIHAV